MAERTSGRGLRKGAAEAILVVSALFSLLLYSRSFDNGFFEDDFIALKVLLQHGLWESSFVPNTFFPFYRPVAVCQFCAAMNLFGLASGWYLVLNYLLLLVSSFIFFRLLLELDFDRPVAALAAGLVLVGFGHYGKSVMWACCGPALSALLFVLLALLGAHRWLGRPAGGSKTSLSRRALLPAGLFFLLLVLPTLHEIGLLASPLVLLTLLVRRGLPKGSAIARSAAFLLPPLVWIAVLSRLPAHYHTYSWIGSINLGLLDRLVRYAAFVVLPAQPTAYSSAVLGRAAVLMQLAAPAQYILGSAILIGLALLFLRGSRPMRVTAAWTGALLFFIAHVPEPGRWLELRYLYYVAFPFAAIVAASLAWLYRRPVRGTRPLALGIGAVLLLESAGTVFLLERKYDAMRRDPSTMEQRRQVEDLYRERPAGPHQP